MSVSFHDMSICACLYHRAGIDEQIIVCEVRVKMSIHRLSTKLVDQSMSTHLVRLEDRK